jgi:hypothetical protein
MKTRLCILSLLLFANLIAFTQSKTTVSGFVKDADSGEILVGANVFETGSSNGCATDNNGYFTIVVNKPSTISFSYIGYIDTSVIVDSYNQQILQINLRVGNQLQEVIVKSQTNKQHNTSNLKILELSVMPSLTSKPDIAKSLQMLPGINSQGEGSSLLLIRGGDAGQNLYLFDDVPIIYVNHLGGFMSIFNPEIINHIEVYKAEFPSRYGGRLSSIINITQKEGNTSKFVSSFSLGLTDASFCVEGPTKIKNSSFIITGRKTFIDAYLASFSKFSDANNFVITYGFHDINTKFTWKPNLKNSVSINAYYGDDYLSHWTNSYGVKTHNSNIWGNILVSTKWNRVISSKLFATTNLSYTKYRLKDKYSFTYLDSTNNKYFENLKSTVSDYLLRSNWKYSITKNWLLNFGLESSLKLFSPNQIEKTNETVMSVKRILTNETAYYLGNNINIGKVLNLNLGARLVNYFNDDYFYCILEPRMSLNINIFEKHSINASYMKVSQCSHLIVTSGKIMSNEIWVPSNKNIQPATSEQYAVGWIGEFYNNKVFVEVNSFYKTFKNLSTVKEGYNSILGDLYWQSKIETQGSGEAKGIECFINCNLGRVKLMTGYSISNSTRQFDGINGGNEFLFDFDRLHSYSISGSYNFSENLKISMSWVFQSGLPYTPIIGKQLTPSLYYDANGQSQNYEVFIYGDRNSERMKNYHRMDISVIHSKLSKKKKNKVEWCFSIYNLYNRHNPYSYFYSPNGLDGISFTEQNSQELLKMYQISYMPIIPTISYKVYFKGKNETKNQEKKQKRALKNWLKYEN